MGVGVGFYGGGGGKIKSVLFIETSQHSFKALKHTFIC